MTQATALSIQPEWGHPLITPDGRVIRISASTFPLLRMLGVLVNNKPRLSSRIYEFLNPEYDTLALGLRQMLGSDLSGPKWVVCRCRECQGKASDLDDPRCSETLVNQLVREVKARRRIA